TQTSSSASGQGSSGSTSLVPSAGGGSSSGQVASWSQTASSKQVGWTLTLLNERSSATGTYHAEGSYDGVPDAWSPASVRDQATANDSYTQTQQSEATLTGGNSSTSNSSSSSVANGSATTVTASSAWQSAAGTFVQHTTRASGAQGFACATLLEQGTYG